MVIVDVTDAKTGSNTFLNHQAGFEMILSKIVDELLEANDNFPKFASPHEGVAIIQEEFEEFKNAAFWPHKGEGDANKEVLQLAAMAIRYLLDITYKYDVKRLPDV